MFPAKSRATQPGNTKAASTARPPSPLGDPLPPYPWLAPLPATTASLPAESTFKILCNSFEAMIRLPDWSLARHPAPRFTDVDETPLRVVPAYSETEYDCAR